MAKETWKPGNMLYPVPAVMVSCQRPTEKPNIITVAWAGTVCTNPPMLSISAVSYTHLDVYKRQEHPTITELIDYEQAECTDK